VRAPNGHLVSAVSWSQRRDDPNKIDTHGTWVSPRYRGRGVASSLWRAMIDHCKPHLVRSDVISDGGWALTHAMRLEFPRIKFDASDMRKEIA